MKKSILRYLFPPKVKQITITIGGVKSHHICYHDEIIRETLEYKGIEVSVEISDKLPIKKSKGKKAYNDYENGIFNKRYECGGCRYIKNHVSDFSCRTCKGTSNYETFD